MRRTLVQIFHTLPFGDPDLMMTRSHVMGRIDTPCMNIARKLADAINSAAIYDQQDRVIEARLAFQLPLGDGKMTTIPVDDLQRLVDDLCTEGVIDRDSLPAAADRPKAKAATARKPFRADNTNTPERHRQPALVPNGGSDEDDAFPVHS